MEQVKKSDVAVVIVLFNPEDDDVANVRSIASRYRGVIVDNSSAAITADDEIGRMRYMCNHGNLGIAEAQNIGIRMLLDDNVRNIVFLDQDSRVSLDYPSVIAQTFYEVKRQVPNLAVLGPTVKRKDNGEEYKSAVHKDHPVSRLFTPRREVISSGCCMSVDAIRKVGLNDSKLFIDYVDHEWCWRASSAGWACGITPSVCIAHKVGQSELHIFRHVVIISKPFRYFYQYRNYMWLVRRKYVPLQWKLAVGIKFMLRIFYFPFCVKHWASIEKNMFMGIKAGLYCPSSDYL